MRAIDADKFKSYIVDGKKRVEYRIKPEYKELAQQMTDDFLKDIDEQPTLDVQPVVHAHWEDISVHSFESAIVPQGQKKMKAVECSHCQTVSGYPWIGKLQYCPWCGAKMDEVQK